MVRLRLNACHLARQREAQVVEKPCGGKRVDGTADPARRRMAAFVVALCIAAPEAIADTPEVLLREIARCSDIPDAKERLRCFDAAAARAKSVSLTPPVAGEASQARPPDPVTQVEQFGKPTPRHGELQSITATASEFARTSRGKALFVLDNGQVWRQLDGDDTAVPDPPTSGFAVTIERGAFGSFNLTIEGRKGLIKVARLR